MRKSTTSNSNTCANLSFTFSIYWYIQDIIALLVPSTLGDHSREVPSTWTLPAENDSGVSSVFEYICACLCVCVFVCVHFCLSIGAYDLCSRTVSCILWKYSCFGMQECICVHVCVWIWERESERECVCQESQVSSLPPDRPNLGMI